jgi:hypothetical protein
MGIPAGAAAAMSARIGDSRNIYAEGVLSHVNRHARDAGAVPGMTVKAFIAKLLDRA